MMRVLKAFGIVLGVFACVVLAALALGSSRPEQGEPLPDAPAKS